MQLVMLNEAKKVHAARVASAQAIVRYGSVERTLPLAGSGSQSSGDYSGPHAPNGN